MNALLLLAPALASVAAGVACLALGRSPWTPRVALAGAALTCALALAVAARVVGLGAIVTANGWLQADGLSALALVAIGVPAAASIPYGQGYLRVLATLEPAAPRWTPGRWDALTFGLLACLFLAAVANHLGLLWIAIEGATLASALLVGFYRRPDALEAAWKYLILCSVGILLALLATVLLSVSAQAPLGGGAAALEWTRLREVAGALDPRFVRLAFLFALVGYGTKAGLAPMHAWMPDAYSRAPAPASALLSTALFAASLTALLRFHAVTRAAVGAAWPEGLLVRFGLLSMAIAAAFLLVQGEYKRLLAWSSLENAGLVTLAVGLGTPLAVFGALLHLLLQALSKSLAFLCGGSLLRATGSYRMDHWHGALAADPGLGTLLVAAGLGVAGLPPSGTFVSEWLALAGGFAGPRPGFAIAALLALAVSFAGLAFHWTAMVLGRPRAGFADPLPRSSRVPMWALAALLVTLGLWLPGPVRALVEQAAEALR